MNWVSTLEKVLGSSKVQPNNRITLVKQIQKKLNVKIGDIVIYVEDAKGNIILKKGQLKPV
jgi:bifunctional DNA-binding transcriptional regulator/antitoxin component of YhaV-PrlF toxin-antitoxin module